MGSSLCKVEVIREGASNCDDNTAECTIVLLKGPKNILIDPGSPWDKDLIIERLKERGMGSDAMDYVIGTHSHSDHVGNLSLSKRAHQLIGYEICYDGRYVKHAYDINIPFEIDDQVFVIATPGHTDQDISVLIKNVTNMGNVVVCDDIFESKGDLDNLKLFNGDAIVTENGDDSVDEASTNSEDDICKDDEDEDELFKQPIYTKKKEIVLKNGETPLMSAASSARVDIVRYILSLGVDVNHKLTNSNSCALLSLASNKSVGWRFMNNSWRIDAPKVLQMLIDAATTRLTDVKGYMGPARCCLLGTWHDQKKTLMLQL